MIFVLPAPGFVRNQPHIPTGMDFYHVPGELCLFMYIVLYIQHKVLYSNECMDMAWYIGAIISHVGN